MSQQLLACPPEEPEATEEELMAYQPDCFTTCTKIGARHELFLYKNSVNPPLSSYSKLHKKYHFPDNMLYHRSAHPTTWRYNDPFEIFRSYGIFYDYWVCNRIRIWCTEVCTGRNSYHRSLFRRLYQQLKYSLFKTPKRSRLY
jgi:hypothetical protein